MITEATMTDWIFSHTWSELNANGPLECYYNCTLKIEVGKFKPGYEFEAILIDTEKRTITLVESDFGYHRDPTNPNYATKYKLEFTLELI